MPNAAKPTVVEALANVMEDVQGIGKGDTNTQQGYKFRGIDAVVNAVGPVLRKHGVVVVPIQAECASEHYTTAKGTQMRGVTLTVGFRFYGPTGDFIEAMVCGEASDSGDKAVPKAHSVAYRTLLLQALCIPTDEPDPDSESHERGKAEAKQATTFKAPVNGQPDEEAVKLATELLELVGQIGEGNGTKAELVPATQLLIGKHAGDKAWLRRQINAAKETLNAAIPF